MSATLLHGDARQVLRRLPEGIFRTCVTSPPYLGLRDYGLPPLVWGGDSACEHRWSVSIRPGMSGGTGKSGLQRDGRREEVRGPSQERWVEANTVPPSESATCVCCGAWRGSLGLEPAPTLYVEHLVEIMREVKRVLADDGTLWLNLGDSYNNRATVRPSSHQAGLGFHNESIDSSWVQNKAKGLTRMSRLQDGLKEKDLLGIPWMVAFALRDDGWYLRMDVVWAKGTSGQKEMAQQVANAARDCGIAESQVTCLLEQLDLYVGNPMPESVQDRPTRSHEYVFLLSKSSRYFYNRDAVAEPAVWQRENNPAWAEQRSQTNEQKGCGNRNAKSGGFTQWSTERGRNRRSVWTIPTKSYKGAHFAVFPPALVEPCLLAGSEEGDLVLDPFCGSGTTGEVALKHGRDFVGIDLNEKYLELARQRLEQGR